MKTFLLAFTLITLKLTAQDNLKFDKRFVQSEDKWVAFQKDKDGEYTYGFIYIDAQAGLTLNYEGKFMINSSGNFIPTKLDSTNLKIRLQPNNVHVAFIPEDKFGELKISKVPEWLKFYKTDTSSAKHLYDWGYMYNGWDECATALPYLLRAKQVDPNYEGLNVEIAFSYNCLKEYDKAELIIEEELNRHPTNAYVNKEYIFTLSKTTSIEKATKQYYKSLESVKDKTYNAENCYNIMQYFYKADDTKNFNTWYTEYKKWPTNDQLMIDAATKMNAQMNK